MKKRNLTTLEQGLNYIEITQDELGLNSGKFPIAIIPANYKVINVRFETIEKFKITERYINYRMKLGTHANTQHFLTSTENIALYTGNDTANTGAYFDSTATSVFDNETELVLETLIIPRVWSIGGDLITEREQHGGCGSQHAALCFGGDNNTAGNNVELTTESYNGITWSDTGHNNSNAKRDIGSCGTQTDAMSLGGSNSSTHIYNGTIWINGVDMPSIVDVPSAVGNTTSALCFGGNDGNNDFDDPITDTIELISGIWSSVANLNIARARIGPTGSVTAALAISGMTDWTNPLNVNYSTVVHTTAVEEYNGTTWSSIDSLNVALSWGSAASGTTDAALSFGFEATEEFDGTSWRSVNHLIQPSGSTVGCGTQNLGLKIGGNTMPFIGYSRIKTTEEYSGLDTSSIFLSGKLNLSIAVINGS